MGSLLKDILSYVWSHKIMCFVAFYILLSAFIKSVSGIDICIPCIWKTLTGIECPGCGLTTALTKLMQFDFSGAMKANVLIFIIGPVGLFYLVNDYRNFTIQNKRIRDTKAW